MGGLLRRIARWPAWAKGVAIVVALLAAGAGISVPVVLRSQRPAATVATRPSQTPAPAISSTVEPTPAPSPTPITLSCRLPISNGSSGGGGFITFPAGTFASDPASGVTGAGPLKQFFGLSYDRAGGKWLPVPRSWVLPDGTRYVYVNSGNATVNLATLSTGLDLWLGPKPDSVAADMWRNHVSWRLVEALDEGVYAVPEPGGPTPGAGLWIFPYNETERQVTKSNYFQAIGGGAAWGTVAPSVPSGAATTIIRFDLKSGATVDWFSRPGRQARVLGFDTDGHPVIVTTSQGATEVWLATAADSARQLLALQADPAQSGPGAGVFVQSALGDGNGVWLATSKGLYLAAASTTQRMSDVTGVLAGGCA